jgi:hypothetical protein
MIEQAQHRLNTALPKAAASVQRMYSNYSQLTNDYAQLDSPLCPECTSKLLAKLTSVQQS